MSLVKFPLTMVLVRSIIEEQDLYKRKFDEYVEKLTNSLIYLYIVITVAESMDAPEDLITMDNGCVCCSVRGDLVRTLGQLSKRRKDFDAILLETTGLAVLLRLYTLFRPTAK